MGRAGQLSPAAQRIGVTTYAPTVAQVPISARFPWNDTRMSLVCFECSVGNIYCRRGQGKPILGSRHTTLDTGNGANVWLPQMDEYAGDESVGP